MRTLILAGLLLAAAPAIAAPVTVTDAWARASLPHQNTSAAYMVLSSSKADALTGVTAAEAGMAMLHQSTRSGGMAGMEDMDSLALPAGQAVTLAPGGTHIMLMDLPHPLRAGQTLHLTLHFAHAPDQGVTLPVRPIGSAGP
jgi:copper(I)-binding protein